MDDVVRSLMYRIATLEAQLAAVTAQLETERLCLAACGTAALGYYKRGEPIAPEYWSSSLDDVLKLREQLAEVTAERDVLHRLNNNRARANELLIEERDSLRAALRQIAEAAKIITDSFYGHVGMVYGSEIRALKDALALTVVQDVLKAP